jgi:glycosyltransferase involved in cell wall biosynthesis
VVIPCKANEGTIRATVDALLAQDYRGLAEVIVVGDVGDSTWAALRDVHDSRLVILEQEKMPGKRDPNIKRDKGIRRAIGDVIALADSDIVMDPDWLSKAVAMLLAQGGGLVAGGMRSIHDTFWGRFVDRNVLAAKTPRLPRPYLVTAENFGKRGYKPPVTANAVFTRELYRNCPLDVTWAYGYEDYEWFWRLAKGGHKILFSGELTAAHHHRRSFRRLAKEYRQSAYGCAKFVEFHNDSPLAVKRFKQAFFLPIVALVSLAAIIIALADGYAEQVGIAVLYGSCRS